MLRYFSTFVLLFGFGSTGYGGQPIAVDELDRFSTKTEHWSTIELNEEVDAQHLQTLI